jgi:photosystem II stability/assembly factor-like uncharacterized protein
VIRSLAVLLFLSIPSTAQHSLVICASVSKNYVVGAKLSPSGLFFYTNNEWRHVGFNHPFLFAADYDPSDPSTLYLAAGNGLFRAAKHGEEWTQLTGSDVTELRDLAIDSRDPKTIYYAYSHGIRVTHDGGQTWEELAGHMHRRYTEAIRVDSSNSQHLVAGGEEGVFQSSDGGKTWTLAGAASFQILRIEQSMHNACDWLAITQGGGLFASHDCGITFESSGRIGVGRDLYSISFDPTNANRIALGGWGPGVVVSDDGGKTWQARNQGLPSVSVWCVAFDPDHVGRIYASLQEAGIFISDDAGRHWRSAGLEGSVVWRMKFVP